jgi:hypothetical protein
MAMSPCQRHRAQVKAAKALDNREALTASPLPASSWYRACGGVNLAFLPVACATVR